MMGRQRNELWVYKGANLMAPILTNSLPFAFTTTKHSAAVEFTTSDSLMKYKLDNFEVRITLRAHCKDRIKHQSLLDFPLHISLCILVVPSSMEINNWMEFNNFYLLHFLTQLGPICTILGCFHKLEYYL